MSKNNYTLESSDVGKRIDLIEHKGSVGPSVVDVTSIYELQGVFTFDPGFASTACCKSDITYIDGEKGILMYRGYPIEALAKSSNFLEVSYLLLNGELPNKEQMENFKTIIGNDLKLDQIILNVLKAFNANAHPMAILSAALSSMAALHNDSVNISNKDDRKSFNIKIIAQVPIIASAAFRHISNKDFIAPNKSLGYCDNILNMFFADTNSNFEINPITSEALDLLLILHADHEQNCSTSTVRMSGSSGVNPYAAIAAGVTALWGPAHGGANEAVINMLDQIESIDQIDTYVNKAKDKKDPFRLMGFGHRVYKNYDPRATIIREMCHRVLNSLGQKSSPILDKAIKLEEIALKDDYFIEKNLYPNVDFYSGIIYQAIGIPKSMFTVMFAIARCAGWLAHWNEMIEDPLTRIGRPRQLYTGAKERSYIAIKDRN
ncbi:MAG: citrate synthase [Pseudomonadota bacterium]|nr:citrate (Si)-synthase [Gammaproteobacteria bacterium]MEE2684211.1 citrate synthase [Pseudomonadota bacterium]|tara:strand:- start:236 stop:1534 length:1299 start_codon:yes stop_codon:yes gene_type:complete